VNEAFAKHHFGGASAVGRWLSLDGPQQNRAEIVGVVKDMKYESLRHPAPRTVFFALRNMPESHHAQDYVVRTHPAAANPQRAIETAVARIDTSLSVVQARSMTDHISRTLLQERMMATLTSSLGVLGLGLVAIGVYGVVAFQVTRRTKEMGIRLALGARPRQIVLLMVREMLVPVAVGVFAGVTASLQITSLAERMLFGVAPTDGATLAGSSLLLVGIALAAAWLPGRRAARVNPATTLRGE
jgi:ABC-type lipoprotein release transport system permease subunit